MLDGMNFNLNGTSVFLKFLGSEYPKFGVFDGEEIYKVQDVLVYMPPTITYIYGLKKHLFVLISSTTTKSPNVARVGTGCTVKY